MGVSLVPVKLKDSFNPDWIEIISMIQGTSGIMTAKTTPTKTPIDVHERLLFVQQIYYWNRDDRYPWYINTHHYSGGGKNYRYDFNLFGLIIDVGYDRSQFDEVLGYLSRRDKVLLQYMTMEVGVYTVILYSCGENDMKFTWNDFYRRDFSTIGNQYMKPDTCLGSFITDVFGPGWCMFDLFTIVDRSLDSLSYN